MGLASLHAVGVNRQHAGFQIDLRPAGSDNYWIYQVAISLLPKLKRHRDRTPKLKLWLKGDSSLATPRNMMPLLACSGIRRLSLKTMAFRRGEELLRILAPFPVLENCFLRSVTLGMPIDPAAIQRNIPATSLEKITFSDCAPTVRTGLIRWLMSGQAGQHIRSRWCKADAEAVVELSRDLGVHQAARKDHGKLGLRLLSSVSEHDSSM